MHASGTGGDCVVGTSSVHLAITRERKHASVSESRALTGIRETVRGARGVDASGGGDEDRDKIGRRSSRRRDAIGRGWVECVGNGGSIRSVGSGRSGRRRVRSKSVSVVGGSGVVVVVRYRGRVEVVGVLGGIGRGVGGGCRGGREAISVVGGVGGRVGGIGRESVGVGVCIGFFAGATASSWEKRLVWNTRNEPNRGRQGRVEDGRRPGLRNSTLHRGKSLRANARSSVRSFFLGIQADDAGTSTIRAEGKTATNVGVLVGYDLLKALAFSTDACTSFAVEIGFLQ
jgi:hypothetical protein